MRKGLLFFSNLYFYIHQTNCRCAAQKKRSKTNIKSTSKPTMAPNDDLRDPKCSCPPLHLSACCPCSLLLKLPCLQTTSVIKPSSTFGLYLTLIIHFILLFQRPSSGFAFQIHQGSKQSMKILIDSFSAGSRSTFHSMLLLAHAVLKTMALA